MYLCVFGKNMYHWFGFVFFKQQFKKGEKKENKFSINSPKKRNKKHWPYKFVMFR